jgi:hypothetical protein
VRRRCVLLVTPAVAAYLANDVMLGSDQKPNPARIAVVGLVPLLAVAFAVVRERRRTRREGAA